MEHVVPLRRVLYWLIQFRPCVLASEDVRGVCGPQPHPEVSEFGLPSPKVCAQCKWVLVLRNTICIVCFAIKSSKSTTHTPGHLYVENLHRTDMNQNLHGRWIPRAQSFKGVTILQGVELSLMHCLWWWWLLLRILLHVQRLEWQCRKRMLQGHCTGK